MDFVIKYGERERLGAVIVDLCCQLSWHTRLSFWFSEKCCGDEEADRPENDTIGLIKVELEFGWNSLLPPESRDLGGGGDDYGNTIYVSESINGGHFTTKRAEAHLEGACAWYLIGREESPKGKSKAFVSVKKRGMESNKNMANGVDLEAVGVWVC